MILHPWAQPLEQPIYLRHDQRNDPSPLDMAKKMTLLLKAKPRE